MSGKATHYTLTPHALADLEDIWRYGAETWSPEQADRYIDMLAGTFALLVELPEVARERDELTPAVRIHRQGEHVVIYQLSGSELLIIRILGGRQDWRAHLDQIDR